MDYHYDRAYYRLVYPMALRPQLRTGNQAFEVMDLSEQGVRFRHPGPARPAVGTKVAGTLRLPTGEVLEIEGAVVRVEAPGVSVALSKGVPFGIMIEQQRFIGQRRFTTL